MSVYLPQPGTIAARAIAHLTSLPPGTVLTSAQIAEALDLDDSKTIYPSLITAVRHGLLYQDTKADDRRILLWSLADGLKPLADVEVDEPLHPIPQIPKTTLVWPGLAVPPPDPRPANVIAGERAWEAGKQKPHRGKTPDVGRKPGLPPKGETPVPKRKPDAAPMDFADIGGMQITDDPITPQIRVGGDKYGPLFAKMKPGQSVKCRPEESPKVAGALRKWVKEHMPGATVSAVRKYPKDGMGRVWLLAPVPGKKAA